MKMRIKPKKIILLILIRMWSHCTVIDENTTIDFSNDAKATKAEYDNFTHGDPMDHM